MAINLSITLILFSLLLPIKAHGGGLARLIPPMRAFLNKGLIYPSILKIPVALFGIRESAIYRMNNTEWQNLWKDLEREDSELAERGLLLIHRGASPGDKTPSFFSDKNNRGQSVMDQIIREEEFSAKVGQQDLEKFLAQVSLRKGLEWEFTGEEYLSSPQGRLKLLREERGISIATLSRETGLDSFSILAIERGEKPIDLPTTVALASFFEVEPQVFTDARAINETSLRPSWPILFFRVTSNNSDRSFSLPEGESLENHLRHLIDNSSLSLEEFSESSRIRLPILEQIMNGEEGNLSDDVINELYHHLQVNFYY